MDFIQILMGILTGAFLLSGILSVSLAIKKIDKKINISYSVISLLLIIDVWFSFFRYSAVNLDNWLILEKLQNSCLILIGLVFVLFISFLTESNSKYKVVLNALVLSFFFIINCISPFGISYSHIEFINFNTASFYRQDVTGSPSFANIVVLIYLLYFFYYLVSSTITIYKKGEKKDGIFLGASIGIIVISLMTDIVFIHFKILNIHFIEEIGFTAFIAMVIHRNYNSIVKTNYIKDDLLEIERRYRTLVDSSPDAILVQINGKILFANKNFLELFGVSGIEELADRSAYEFLHPDSLKNVLERQEYMLRYSVVMPPVEINAVKNDNEIKSFEMRSSLVNFGGTRAIQSILRDITVQKKTEYEVTKLSKAVEQCSVAIIITNPRGGIEYVNPKYEEMTGYKSEEVVGEKAWVILAENIPLDTFDTIIDAVRAGITWRGELLNRRKNGELYWSLEILTPIRNKMGEITNYVAVKEDITEQKKSIEELLKAKEAAEQANRLKTNLLSNVSHEFRTPLNGILGYSQILRDSLINKHQLEMTLRITKSGERLLNTLNSILFLTEIENKSYVLNKNEIELGFFCHKLKLQYEQLATAAGIGFSIDVPGEPIWLITDETLLFRTANAILENAFKYTKQGKISISLELYEEKSGQKNVVIKITDTGIGIKPENQKLIFKEFKQLSEGYGRIYEGLGIGLSIASKMMELIGGEIKLESKFGKGSTFLLQIPIDKKDETNKNNTKASRVSHSVENHLIEKTPEILLVEDNLVNIEVIEHYLSDICILSSATNGEDAIRMAQENEYRMFLLDINLGQGTNGIEVMTKIKEMEKYKSTPAIALTGYAADADKKEFIEKGFSGFLAKPFNKAELIFYITTILEKSVLLK